MNAYHNAAKSYKKSDPEGPSSYPHLPRHTDKAAAAVSALHQAIKLLSTAGNFRQAADREKEVGPRAKNGMKDRLTRHPDCSDLRGGRS